MIAGSLFFSLAVGVEASVPGNFTALGTSTTAITLNWTNGGGTTSYRVERSSVSGSSGFAEIATTSTPGYVDSGLSEGKVYWYRIRDARDTSYTSPVGAVTRMGGTLTLSGRHILDATGQVFVPRGVEDVFAQVSDTATVDNIASTGANAVRMLLTMDKINGMTPAGYDRIIAQAVSHKMVVWISLYSWDSAHGYVVADAFGGGTLNSMADYLPIWQRQWMKDLVYKYREWIMIDAMQEFIATKGNSFDAATQNEWKTAATNQIKAFRAAGYTEPLEIMANFQGRDLDGIVVLADSIRGADTVQINGQPQTLFGWQAYWGPNSDGTPGWYETTQGSMLRGQTTTAAQAVNLFVATRNYPIMAGLLDGYDVNNHDCLSNAMPACATNSVGWLWWAWGDISGSASLKSVLMSSAAGFGGAQVVNTSVSATNYAGWRATGFGADATNDAIAGPLADPDHAGLPNFLRYAFSLNARGPVGSATAMGTTGTGALRYLTLAFNRRAAAADLSYIVEGSSNLVNWSTVATYTPGSPTRVTAQDNVSFGAATRHFLRVRVAAVP